MSFCRLSFSLSYFSESFFLKKFFFDQFVFKIGFFQTKKEKRKTIRGGVFHSPLVVVDPGFEPRRRRGC